MCFLWFSKEFQKGNIIPIRLKNGFLTLGNEINEGIRNNIWFCGDFMNKEKLEKEGKMEAREGKGRGMQHNLIWIFVEYQTLGEGKV